MNIKKYGLIAVVLLFFMIFTTSVFADIEVISVKDTITTSETAKFDVKITNEDSETHTYFLNVPMFSKWSSFYNFPREGLELKPGMVYEFDVKLNPMDATPNIYELYFSVSREDKVSYENNFKVFVYPSKPVQYGPSISLVADMKDTIDPQDEQIINLDVRNNNPLNYEQLKISLKSDVNEFNKEQIIKLAPNDRKTIQFEVKPNKFMNPGRYLLFFTAGVGDETYQVLEKFIQVSEKENDFNVELEEKSGFFIVKEKIKIHNPGNIKNTQLVKYEANFFDRIITSSEGSDMQTIDGDLYFTWDVTLSPDEEKYIEIRTNYVWPIIVMILILAGILFYFKYIRKPVVAIKSLTKVDFDKGSITGGKLSLTIKNTSDKEITNINIVDRLPKLMTYKEGEGFETLKPSFMKNKKGEMLLKWYISQLDPKEERIITYGIKSNLNIVGEVTIMPTQITYEVNDKADAVYSNRIKIRTRN